MSKNLSENYKWNIIKSYFDKHSFINHQITTFDDYLNNGIQRVLKECDIVISQKDSKYTISFGDIYIPSPIVIDEDRKIRKLYPKEARQRDLYYDSPIFVDIHEKYEVEDKEPEINTYKRVIIARTPIMIGSSRCNLLSCTKEERIKKGECEWDNGGYFIIKGKERVLVGQIRGIYNQPLVFKQKLKEKWTYVCEARSMSEETGHSVLIQAKISNDNRTIAFSLQHIKEPINVGIVFKAFGFLEEKELRDIVGGDERIEKYIKYIIRDSYFITTQEDALRYIGKYSMQIIKEENRLDYASQVIENEILPHMGITATMKEKVYFLGDMVKKLLYTFIGVRMEDDRDNYINKRVEMAGVLCCDLFRTLFKRFVKKLSDDIETKKQKPDIVNMITKNTSITLGLKTSFGTGNWAAQKSNYMRTGVSQVISRLTFGATLSHLRRVVIPVGKEGKNTKIRQIHPSQIMYICSSETPEGASIGIVLNLALTTTVTCRIPTVVMKEIIEKCKNFSFLNDNDYIDNNPKVFLNGILIGVTFNWEGLIREFETFKKNGLFDRNISFIYNNTDNEVKIFSDEGRLIRPIFTVGDDGWLNIKESDGVVWDELYKRDLVRFIDNNEAENAVIAMDEKDLTLYKNNFCEICPAMMMGVMASIIPFAEHTPSPRVIYQASMGQVGPSYTKSVASL